MKSRRHSRAEISTKLKQAGMLAAAGKVQSEIAKALGISVMTLHRWRKFYPARAARPSAASAAGHDRRGGRRQTDIVAALQMENRYLRQIVADLVLEKNRLEEAAQPQGPQRPRGLPSHAPRAAQPHMTCHALGGTVLRRGGWRGQ